MFLWQLYEIQEYKDMIYLVMDMIYLVIIELKLTKYSCSRQ